MKITWYGTASVLMETENSAILFDPFLKYLPSGYEPKELLDKRLDAFKKQKNILITHGHFDHLANIKEIYNELPCKIYLTNAPYNTLTKQNFDKEKLIKITPNQTLSFGDFKVNTLQGKHVKFIKKDIAISTFTNNPFKDFKRKWHIIGNYLKYPEKDETLFFEIQVENKLVQLMGSAELKEGVPYSTGADLLILPHQGRSDIDEHNKKIVDILKPKKVLLDHYDDAFPPFSSNVPTEKFCEELSKAIPTSPFIEGEAVEL